MKHPRVVLLLAIAFCWLVPTDFMYAQGAMSRIRILDAQLQSAIASGCNESRTLRSLVASIEQSALIVHVVVHAPGEPEERELAGALRWVTAAGGVRFLRIWIDNDLPANVSAAVFAHELQHALEVARAPGVRDATSFAALYRDIGTPRPHVCLRCYDTADADRVGRNVWAELSHLASRDRSHR